MMKRMMVALWGALATVGMVAGQTPVVIPPASAPVFTESPLLTPVCSPETTSAPAPLPSFWVSADYLTAWIFGNRVAPLVTTSLPGTARTAAGVIGQGAIPLFAGRVNDEVRSGFQIDAGYWFDPEQHWGAELGFLMTESKGTGATFVSDGNTILARPFNALSLNANNLPQGVGQAVLVAFPGSSSGAIDLHINSGNFYTGHFDVVEKLYDEGACRLDGMLGYRYYRYDEGVRISQSISPIDPNFVPGTRIDAIDQFVTNNSFNGGTVGLRGKVAWNALTFGFLARVAVGNLHREVKITGSQSINVPGQAPIINNAGVYALATNIGPQKYDEWSALPELGLNAGWRVNSHLRFRVGYTAMMMNGISRAYEQINTNINPNLFPGGTGSLTPQQPGPTRSKDNVWVQMINFGADVSW